MTTSSLKVVVCAAALAAVPAFAQDSDRPRPPAVPGGPRSPAEWLKRADTNGDGKVTKDEFIKMRMTELEENFSRVDTNNDGVVDEAEAERVAQMMRGGMQGREGGPRPEGRMPDGGPRSEGFRGPEGGRRPEGFRGPDGGSRPEGFRGPDGGPRPEGGRGPDGERRPGGPGPEGMDQAFQRFDRDGDGRLSRDEFNEGMTRLREMMQRSGGMMPGQMAGPGGGPGEGFRRPPQQDAEPRGPGRPEGGPRPARPEGDSRPPRPDSL
jgi:Ca2+-binding EF-hand superfamily protein